MYPYTPCYPNWNNSAQINQSLLGNLRMANQNTGESIYLSNPTFFQASATTAYLVGSSSLRQNPFGIWIWDVMNEAVMLQPGEQSDRDQIELSRYKFTPVFISPGPEHFLVFQGVKI